MLAAKTAWDGYIWYAYSDIDEDSLDGQWACIFKLDREFYLDLEYNNDGNIKTSYWPRLNDEWLDPNSQQGKRILARPRVDQTVTAPWRAS